MYTYLMIHPFRDDVENSHRFKRCQKDLKKLLNSNYAVMMSAAKYPTWLHKIMPMQDTITLPTNA